MYLFENLIAKYDNKTKNLFITNAGYFSQTTKERLNGFNNVRLKQKQGIWYLNNVEWNGNWIQIDNVPKTNKIKTSIYE